MPKPCEMPGCPRNLRAGFLCKPHLRRVSLSHREQLRMAEELALTDPSKFELRRVKEEILADLTDKELTRPLEKARKRGRNAVGKGQRGQDQAANAIWKHLGLLAFNPRGRDNVTPALERVVHIEVKYEAAPSINKAMGQAIGDSKGKIPVALTRKVSASVRKEPWLATVRLEDLLELMEQVSIARRLAGLSGIDTGGAART